MGPHAVTSSCKKTRFFLSIVATWATEMILSKGPTDLWMVPVVPSPVAIHSLVNAQFFKQPCVEQPAVQLLQSLMICRELASCVQCSLLSTVQNESPCLVVSEAWFWMRSNVLFQFAHDA